MSERDRRLDEAIAEYLRATQSGQPVTPEEWCRRYPDLTTELSSFFNDRAQIERLARPLREATLAAGPALRSIGNYELVCEIARGGMGVVYRARQLNPPREVAVKMILAGQLASDKEVQRFRAEAESAANLDHPNILPIYEVGEYDNQQYFSMKLIEGGSLAQHLDRYRNDPRAIARLMETIARAVHHAHQRGILHRDLKPGNILLEPDGTPHITDFGLAKRLQGEGGMTQSGALVGTAEYMAPEQVRAQKVLTTAADVYALGGILYTLLTGRPPFQNEDLLTTLSQVLEEEPRAPRTLNPQVPLDLEIIALKCLRKDPGQRYTSAQELAEDLARWSQGIPIQARRTGQLERAFKWARRRPAAAALLVVSVVGAVVLAAISAALFEINQELLANNTQLDQANSAKDQAYDALTRKSKETEDARKDALDKGAELQRQVERMRAMLFAGQVQKAVQLADTDPLTARALLEDQSVCFPWLRDFIWGATYRRSHAFHLLPASQTLGSLLVSADGKVLAHWGSGGGTVQMLELPSGRDITPKINNWPGLEDMSGPVHRSIALSPDGKLLAVGMARLREFLGGFGGPGLGGFPGMGQIPRPEPNQGALHLYDTVTGQKRATFAANQAVGEVVFSPSGEQVAAKVVIGQKHFLKIWEIATSKEIRSLEVDGTCQQIAFGPNGENLFAGILKQSAEGGKTSVLHLQCWRVADGTSVWSAPLPGPSAGQLSLSVGPDGKMLAVHNIGRYGVWLVQAQDGRMLRTLENPGTPNETITLAEYFQNSYSKGFGPSTNPSASYGQTVSFSSDGRILAGATPEGVQLWEVATGRPIRRPEVLARSLGFLPDGHTLALSTVPRGSASQNISTQLVLWDVQYNPGQVLEANITPTRLDSTGRVLVGRSVKEKINQLFDLASNQSLTTLPSTLDHAAFSPDGSLLAGTWKETVRELYDIGSTKPFYQTSTPGDVNLLHLYTIPGAKLILREERQPQPNGDMVVSLEVMERASGKTVGRFRPSGDRVFFSAGRMARCSQDAKYLAIPLHGTRESGTRIWCLATGEVVRVLPGITTVKFSPDGRVVAGLPGNTFAPSDANLLLTEIETGRQVATVPRSMIRRRDPRVDELGTFAFSKDGKTFAIAQEKRIQLWDLSTGAESGALEGHTAPVTTLLLLESGELVSVDETGAWKCWDLQRRQATVTSKIALEKIAQLTASPDGKHLATATSRGIQIWEIATGTLLHAIKDDAASAGELEFLSGGTELLAWGSGKVLQVSTGQESGTFRNGPRRPFTTVYPTSDGKLLLTSSQLHPRNSTQQIKGWPEFPTEAQSLTWPGVAPQADIQGYDLATGKKTVRLPGVQDPALLSPDGRFLVSPVLGSGSIPANQPIIELTVTDVATGKVSFRISDPYLRGGRVRFTPDNKSLILALSREQTQIWDLDTHTRRASIPARAAWDLPFSPNGKVLLSTGRELGLWDMTTGKPWAPIAQIVGYPVAFTRDGSILATRSVVGNQQEITFWDLEKGKKLPPLVGKMVFWFKGILAGDGHSIYAATDTRGRNATREVVRWDLRAGKVLQTFPPSFSIDTNHPFPLSPDGRWLILYNRPTKTPQSGGTVPYLFDTATGEKNREFPPGSQVTFLAGGQTLLVSLQGTHDRPPTSTLSESATGRELLTLPGLLQLPQFPRAPGETRFPESPGSPPCACPTPEGRTLLYAQGGVIHVYDAATGALQRTIEGEPTRLPVTGLSPEGKVAVSFVTTWQRDPGRGSVVASRQIRFWDRTTGEPHPGINESRTGIEIGPDHRTLQAQRVQTQLTLWDARSGKERLCVKGIAGVIKGLAWSPDGQSLATVALRSETAKPGQSPAITQIWNVATGEQRQRLESEAGTPVFSQDGRLLAISGKEIQLWEAETGTLRRTLPTTGTPFFAEGSKTLITKTSAEIQLWDVESGQKRATLLSQHEVLQMQVTTDGKGLMTTSIPQGLSPGVAASWHLTVWDVRTGRERASTKRSFTSEGGRSPLPTWTPDGRLVALGLPNSRKSKQVETIEVFDLETGQESLQFSVPSNKGNSANPILRLEFVDQGRRLLGFLHDGRVVVWETEWPARRPAYAHSGFWIRTGQELVQELVTGGTLLFGDPQWKEYDLQGEISPSGPGLVGVATRVSGMPCPQFLFHSNPEGRSGVWEEHTPDGIKREFVCREEARAVKTPLTPGQWYRVFVSVRGATMTVKLDGQLIGEFRSVGGQGLVGLVSHGCAARFRNFRVTHALGETLWEGLPSVPPPAPETLAARHIQEAKQLRAAGKAEAAFAEFVRATQAQPSNQLAHKEAGLLAKQLGKRDEAIAHFARIPLDRQARNLLEDLYREICREKLSEFLEGKRTLDDAQARVILAAMCAEADYPRAAARFYQESFDQTTWLREAHYLPHRIQAARAAARAGTGQGKDAPQATEQERQAWRQRARAWLEEDLRARVKRVQHPSEYLGHRSETDSPLNAATFCESVSMRRELRSWQTDPAFAGVHDPALQQLPAEERAQWRKLWADVESWQQTLTALSFGGWHARNQMLIHEVERGEFFWLIGDRSWKDVTVEVEAQPRNGQGSLGVLVRAQGVDDLVQGILGDSPATPHRLVLLKPGLVQDFSGARGTRQLETDRWYRLRLEAQGNHLRFFVDDQLIKEVEDTRFSSGQVGLATWNRAVNFRNFKVKDPQGKVLSQGTPLPQLNQSELELLRRGRQQFDAGEYSEAEFTYRALLKQRPDLGAGYFWLANALRLQSRTPEALALNVQALQFNHPEPHVALNNLGILHEQEGRLDQAELELSQAVTLAPNYSLSSANLQRVRKRKQTLDRITSWEKSEQRWLQPGELAELAISARDDCQRHVISTRMLTLYLQRVPPSATFNGVSAFYEAACSAARAGTGQGDARNLPEGERAKFRAQALDWLKLELGRYQKAFKTRPASVAGWLSGFARHWQADPDLEAVRSAQALQTLPEKERADWTRLWDEIKALQKQADETPAGSWRIEGQELVQSESQAPGVSVLTFGDVHWVDYNVELEIQNLGGGAGEIDLLFRAANDHDFMALVLGGWESFRLVFDVQNVQRHSVKLFARGGPQGWVGPAIDGNLATRRWHRVRLEVRGTTATVFLNGTRILVANGLPRKQGKVGLRTFQTSARFRNLKVTDPTGKVLLEGLPPLPTPKK